MKSPLWLYGQTSAHQVPRKERLFGSAWGHSAEKGPFKRSICSRSLGTSSRSLSDPSWSHPKDLPSGRAWERPRFPLFLQSGVNTCIVTIVATCSFIIELRGFLRKSKDAPLSQREEGDGQLAQIGAVRERPETPATGGSGGQCGGPQGPFPPSASPKKAKAR